MKRLVAMVVAAGAAVAAVAMPTKAELQKAQEMVSDVTAADVAALKAKTKTPAEVAAKHMELAGQSGSEAEKYLLLQAAFKLYAKAGDYDAAANVIEKLQAEITDYDPEVTVELCGAEFIRKMRENAPRLYALKENARRIVFYRRQLPIREAAVKKNPRDPQAQRKLAECHAELGDWPKALDVFVKAGGEFKKMSEGETSGKIPAQELGDFWWGYETKSDTLVYKLHAAELYRKALADGSFKGLVRTRAEQRVKEVAGNAAIVAAAGQGASPRTPAATGLYCVIDLSGGPDAKKYPVSYLNDMPKGGWSDEYKTTKLVLRRIEPGAFMMGGGNNRHSEKIDKAFYLGVFEVTQKQWELVMGNRPSYFGGPSWRVRPVDQISYDTIRGKQEGMKWPASDAVDSDSFLGIVRQKSGLRFDLPTQAQWEYACRSGTETDFYNGKNCVNDEHDSSLEGLARYAYTGGWNESWGANNLKSRWSDFWKAPDRNCDTNNATAAVGTYRSNQWGLYDMLGNVREWCLQKGEKGINLGGCWIDGADACKVYSVNQIAKHRGRHDFGFRLCLPLAGGAATQSATTATVAVEKDLYCVIDLSAGPDAKKYRVSYLNGVPKGGWTGEYKTTKLVLRRVEPGKPVLVGRGGGQRRTSVSKPYYLGVFEVTQGQWEQVMGTRPSFWRSKEYRKRPVECVSYSMIRGKDKGSEWPSSNAVDEESFLGLLREKTGKTFDLPTDKQWEYACAAGTESDYNNGGSCSDNNKNAAMDAVGRYGQNGGWDDKFGNCPIYAPPSAWNSEVREKDTKYGTAAVGSYVPNKWGFYDMHGNVWEWCLDWENGDKHNRVVRSGWWFDIAVECCTWIRKGWGPNEGMIMHGFRLCLPLVGDTAAQAHAAPPSAGSIELKTGGNLPFTVKGNEATLDLGEKYGKLEFVKCPAGRVDMVVFQHGETCKVNISRPFWIMKRPLTRKQMAYLPQCSSGEGYSFELRERTDEFVDLVMDNFGASLPKKYVLRLPTLAEWEYAFHANTRNRDDPYFDLLGHHPDDEVAKKIYNFPWKNTGRRNVANAWGLTDFQYEKVLDKFNYSELNSLNAKEGGGIHRIPNPTEKVDPLYWTADGGDQVYISKIPDWTMWQARRLSDEKSKTADNTPARLVIGPDLVSEWKAKHKK